MRLKLILQMMFCLLTWVAAGSVIAQNEAYVGAFEVRWSPDGRWIGVGSTDGIWIFDAEAFDAEPYHYAGVNEGRNSVYIAEFDPVRPNVAFAPSDEAQVYVVDIETGAEVFRADTPADDDSSSVFYDLGYSADGRFLSVLNTSLLYVLDAATGDWVHAYFNPVEVVGSAGIEWLTSLDYDDDTTAVLVSDWSANLFVYRLDSRSGLAEHALDINDGIGYRLEQVTTMPGDQQALLMGWGGLYSYDLASRELTPISELEAIRVKGFDLSPDGTRVAVGGGTRVYLYDLVNDQLVGEFESDFREESERNWIYSLAFSPDGERIASLQTDGQLKIWEIATGEVVAELGEFNDGGSQKWG